MTPDELQNHSALRVLRAALWHEKIPALTDTEWRSVYETFRSHGLSAMPADILSKADTLPDDLRAEWKKRILQQVVNNRQLAHEEERVLKLCEHENIPVIVLKGSAAAQYYPRPYHRAMGDIDLMTRREDFPRLCELLLRNGFIENTTEADEERGRHRCFSNGIATFEAHLFFTSSDKPEEAEYLDGLLLDSIHPDWHFADDPVNGLSLLQHIRQHLRSGLDLRRVCDWLYFVDRHLDDRLWEDGFREMARNAGLEALAVTLTRMGQLYLGLDDGITWCKSADEALCAQLMAWTMAKTEDNINPIALPYTSHMLKHPASLFARLQKRGLENWKAAQTHPVLKPFAWGYQLIRSGSNAFGSLENAGQLRSAIRQSKNQAALLERLGVPLTTEHLVKIKEDHFE